MKLYLFLLAAFALSMLKLQAQDLEKSLLWEISGNDLTESSFLYGTIHMTCDATLDDDVKKAMDDTSRLVLELDMDDPTLQTEMMKGIYMKNGTTMKGLFSNEDYVIISKFVKDQMGIPLEALGDIKPFFISAMFYPKLMNCPVQSYENALMALAHEQKEEVFGLETFEEQLNVFDEIPYEDQATDLLRSVKDNLSYDKDAFSQMLALYNAEDIEGMDMMMKEDKNLSTTKHRATMLDDRNKNWISKIEAFSKEQATFYGVGAGHLAGENGVINLLRKEGYTVKAVL